MPPKHVSSPSRARAKHASSQARGIVRIAKICCAKVAGKHAFSGLSARIDEALGRA
jgi:hypothetical protein